MNKITTYVIVQYSLLILFLIFREQFGYIAQFILSGILVLGWIILLVLAILEKKEKK